MEEKKKSNVGLIILVVILLLACAGMGSFIFINKDKLTAKENSTTTKVETIKDTTNDSTEKSSNDIFKDDTIKISYYETKQEGTEKYNLTLINTGKNYGYFTLRYVSAYGSGSEAPSTNGYYLIKDSKLVLSVGPYTNENNLNNTNAETIFKKAGATLDIDPEQDHRDSNPPSYYNMYSTEYNEKEIVIGNKTFYNVK